MMGPYCLLFGQASPRSYRNVARQERTEKRLRRRRGWVSGQDGIIRFIPHAHKHTHKKGLRRPNSATVTVTNSQCFDLICSRTNPSVHTQHYTQYIITGLAKYVCIFICFGVFLSVCVCVSRSKSIRTSGGSMNRVSFGLPIVR